MTVLQSTSEENKIKNAKIAKNERQVMRCIFLGAPGSGKGTYAGPLSDTWKVPTIATGDILRENIKSETELGKKIKHYLEQGALVPDEVVTDVIAERLQREDTNQGFILDGFPRTLKQAEALNEILVKQEKKLDVVLNIDVSRDIIIKRLTGRRLCPQCKANFNANTNLKPKVEGQCDHCNTKLITRADDNVETITKRLEVYQEQTKPLIDFYKQLGLLKTISPHSSEVDEIIEEIKTLLS